MSNNLGVSGERKAVSNMVEVHGGVVKKNPKAKNPQGMGFLIQWKFQYLSGVVADKDGSLLNLTG